MMDVNETKTVMFGRKTGKHACTACVDTDGYWKKRKNIDYKYVSADSAVGRKWLKKHNIEDIPASKVCTTRTKDGKRRCRVFVGAMPGGKRLKTL